MGWVRALLMSALFHQLFPVSGMFSEPTALTHTQLPGAWGSCFNLEGEENTLDLRSIPCAEHPPARDRFLPALGFKGLGVA